VKCIFWDVQHGSAATIITPNGEHIAVDLGTGSYHGQREFSPLLHLKRNYGVSRLHALVVTHPHRDHLEDIANVGTLSPHILVHPGHLSDDEIRKGNRADDEAIITQYIDTRARFSRSIAPEESLTNPANVGDVKINLFLPDKASRANLSNHSVVVVLNYAGSTLLLPGDNEPVSWKELLQQPGFVEAVKGTDVLVASHHGRDSGFCAELFEVISPKLVIVSDGRFSDTSATDRYSARASGWTVHRRSGPDTERRCLTTRADGAIVVEFGRNGSAPFIDVRID
jgi:competence protein ComEC